MAEVRKKEARKEYIIDKKKNKNKKNKTKKVVSKKQEKVEETTNKSLWVKFRIFCHGVKSEFKKVHWPSKKDMIKYSFATIIFIIFCALFFYLINILFALIQSILN
ncbi:MAG: preprotein translocase subunit SecE [Bacilli bacterium]|nr:preprotein translocase subunit SecE [Bacilli bacterium]